MKQTEETEKKISDLENLINALIKLKADADEQGIQTAFEPKKDSGGNNE